MRNIHEKVMKDKNLLIFWNWRINMNKNNDEKKPLTETEVLDGCSGCLLVGCLPFTILISIVLGTVFFYKDPLQNLLYMVYDFIF
ncbi:hypothetical protein J5Y03_09025 [Bacillus sp. RG28]|uniref:Uncharacterized protein n=1 Tax=Gottfriedia endophytica TaxID=2820819 RepID=A0A940NMK0_9BACI|nr:hypothetical protein [Gottfriedia endophytica]MBP0725331.1 hypothetical protein [Gottfriedia endophytica]